MNSISTSVNLTPIDTDHVMCTFLPLLYVCYLDAVLVEETWQGETFLFIKGLAKDDQLFKEEDSPLLHPAKQTALWVRDHERVLQQKAALSHDLPLEREMNKMEMGKAGVERKTARKFC